MLCINERTGGSIMGYTIAQKIIRNHLVSGNLQPGREIAIALTRP